MIANSQNLNSVKKREKVRLKPETILALREMEKKVLNKYASTKIKIIVALDIIIPEGARWWTQKDLAGLFWLSEDTITKIKQEFLDCDEDFGKWLDSDYGGGNNKKLTIEQEQELSKFVSDNMFCSSAIIQDYIFTTYQQFYSISGVISLLHRLDFTYKKPILVPDKMNYDRQLQWLEYYTCLKEQSKQNGSLILFGDACHPTHNTITQGCWQKIGKANTKEIKAKTGRDRINIMGGYDLDNQTALLEEYDTINAESILDFILKQREQYKWNKELKSQINSSPSNPPSNPQSQINPPNIYNIMDNARVHHSNLVQDWLKSDQNQQANKHGYPVIHFEFLPPYSPNLNKIEPFWKYMKKQIANKFYPTFKDFQQAIQDFITDLDLPHHRTNLARFITNKFHLFQGG